MKRFHVNVSVADTAIAPKTAGCCVPLEVKDGA
jgi:hypothetical protein